MKIYKFYMRHDVIVSPEDAYMGDIRRVHVRIVEGETRLYEMYINLSSFVASHVRANYNKSTNTKVYISSVLFNYPGSFAFIVSGAKVLNEIRLCDLAKKRKNASTNMNIMRAAIRVDGRKVEPTTVSESKSGVQALRILDSVWIGRYAPQTQDGGTLLTLPSPLSALK